MQERMNVFEISVMKFLKVMSIITLAFFISSCAKLGEDPQTYNLASADSNLPPLTIVPENPRISQGDSKRFHGQGGYVGDVGYRYTLSGIGGTPAPGTLDPITGVYTSPSIVDPSNAIAFITVTDAIGAFVTTTAINIVPLEISPSSQIVTARRKANFDVVGGEPPFTWCVVDIGTGTCLQNADIGEVSSEGLFLAHDLSGSTTVQVMDASGNLAQGVVIVQAIPELYPSGISIPFGWIMQLLTVGGTAPFVYSLDESSVNAGGSISPTGLFIAPTSEMKSTITSRDFFVYNATSDFNIINPNKIVSGENFNCVLFSDTEGIKCWGDSSKRQTGYADDVLQDGIGLIGTDNYLGNESAEIGARIKAHKLKKGTPYTYIISKRLVAGQNHACVIDGANRVRCWGSNSEGQLGISNADLERYAETNDAVTYSNNAIVSPTFIGAGLNHNCVVGSSTFSKRIYCWGSNSDGQIGYPGLGTKLTRPNLSNYIEMPSQILDLKGGAAHTCVLLKGTVAFNSSVNQIRCWGDNNYGQLGFATTNDQDFPLTISEWNNLSASVNIEHVEFTNPSDDLPLNEVLMPIALEVGANHSCALLNDNTVRCWGRNHVGQLGRGSLTMRYDTPDVLGVDLAFQKIVRLRAGWDKTCVILLGGILNCFGDNASGSLGIENSEILKIGISPLEMGSNLLSVSVDLVGFSTDISIGKSHVCAMLNDNRAKCWGENGFGQLGINSTRDYGGAAGDMGRFLLGVAFF